MAPLPGGGLDRSQADGPYRPSGPSAPVTSTREASGRNASRAQDPAPGGVDGRRGGTAGAFPGGAPVGLHLHLALRALHRYGMSPAQALTTVTRTPARVFGVADRLGTVEPGRIADLTLVDGDPFADFADLVRVRAVLRGGVLHQMLRDGCCGGEEGGA
ncbi:amidohydrolase family protein [Streptomyces virginiae]|uniref:amidohydrolase family protein n=1 Tax=Streptomyces virginiae TaxID=1961 RepID=UPI00381CDF7D